MNSTCVFKSTEVMVAFFQAEVKVDGGLETERASRAPQPWVKSENQAHGPGFAEQSDSGYGTVSLTWPEA